MSTLQLTLPVQRRTARQLRSVLRLWSMVFFFTQRETSNRQSQHWIVSFKLRWFYLRGRCQRSPKDMRPVWPQVRGLFCNEEKTFVLIWNPNKITRQVAYSELHRSFVILNLLYFSWRYKNILKHPFKLAKKNKLPPFFFFLKWEARKKQKAFGSLKTIRSIQNLVI